VTQVAGLISRDVIFGERSSIKSQRTDRQTDRQTDGQDYYGNTALYSEVHRALK